jgi:hypothetical protein
MVIDCERCEVRGIACGDCVIGVLLGVPGVPPAVPDGPEEAQAARPPGASAIQLDAPEQRALAVLADQGLVPRLRLVSAPVPAVTDGGHDGEKVRDVG